jgi:RES domain-containing protein
VASWRRRPTTRAGTWTAYRQAAPAFPPLWHRGSQRQPTEQPEGRWHRGGQGLIVQYAALESDGAWAELVRYEGIRTEQQRVDADMTMRLWQLTIEETEIADLADFDTIEACGLDPAEVVAESHTYCQALADELRAEGFRGVLAPSAAYPGVTNLSLFGPRREIPAHELRGRVNPNPGYWVPVNILGDSPPPAHVLPYVRHEGDPHLAFEFWKQQKS